MLVDHRRKLTFLKDKKWEALVKTIKDLEELKAKLERFLTDYRTNTSDWVADHGRKHPDAWAPVSSTQIQAIR